MQHHLTIQEAIFTLSNFNKQIDQLTYRFRSNFFGPVKVDGKPIAHDDKAKSNEEELVKYKQMITDISALRHAIAQANNELIVENHSVTYQLEWVRQTRLLLTQLENLIQRQETRVETGVGVVEYSAYNESSIREDIDRLTKEVNKISSLIDQSNANSMISIDLLTEI
ncbi:hypothetical protein FEZ33_06505 [Ruoffia tabacinasalis]|uniref:Uncharacterized protein n=1 Tax=Ruoffia tabacinasalis TaxID=87458 RepID=A0A5R9DX35_9LACT|nr:hypothetical protein [Ruoffia tabacinasalis]TLQ41189.1 hypothetical protein FEZ33_06505 [Ruoffia tabacinasalis]